MAAASTVSENATPEPSRESAAGLLVSLVPLTAESLEATLANLALAFPDRPIDVATPDPAPSQLPAPGRLHLIPYTQATPAPGHAPGQWLLSAAGFLNAYKLMQEHKSTVCLLLGAEAQSLAPQALRTLADAAFSGGDLITPRYSLGPNDGLVNSALLYPVTRALFSAHARYPLAIDLALSTRMAERLAAAAQSFTAANQNAAILWPVSEAAAAGFSLAEVPVGTRSLPPPDIADLNSLLSLVAGSFFADIDVKAGIWQRARLAYPTRGPAARPAAAHRAVPDTPVAPDIQTMLDSFRLAYTNLQEIWSLVLPPNSLLGLKKLSQMPPAGFHVSDSLWARIVYDFILAYRLRTLNRGHLLGALTPLYLAWVASHLLPDGSGNLSAQENGPSAEDRIEALAATFEAEKPYLVSRWRWPDRFNP